MTPNKRLAAVPEQAFIERVDYCRAFLLSQELISKSENTHILSRLRHWMKSFTKSTYYNTNQIRADLWQSNESDLNAC